MLREHGPQLGRPLVGTVTASQHRNMTELRSGCAERSELRILVAFDPEPRAITLIAGDESGNWTRWYTKNIPAADDLFDDHLHPERRMIEIALSYENLVAKYPVDREVVEAHKERMLAGVCAYRLRELREQAGLT